MPSESGTFDTAVGTSALLNLVTGSQNVALGVNAGASLTGGSLNVYLANPGLATEDNTIRLGTGGSHTRLLVAGTRGVTTGLNNGAFVLIDSNGQLGTVNSSRRTKEDIADLAAVSRSVQRLRPVQFRGDSARGRSARSGLVYIRQVSGFLWRATRVWALVFSGAFVARCALDWFAPASDFGGRASASTATAAVLLFSTAFVAARRSSSLLAGPLAALAMSQVAAVFSVAGAAVLVSIWHDPRTMEAIAASGGLSEVFLLPFLLGIPATALGVGGGAAGLATRVFTG